MTTLIATSVNAAGLAEIHAFLADHHKLGGEHFTPDMLRAWARQAEFQLGEGNPACIEIPARDAVGGAAIEYRISDAGLDFSERWEAWEDGAREEAESFLVPQGGVHDVAALGARALGVDVSDRLNVAQV